MKNNNNDMIEEALSKVLEWVESTESFVAEQAPIVVNEIVAHGLWMYGVGLVFGLALVVASVIICVRIITRYLHRVTDAKDSSEEQDEFVAAAWMIVATLVPLVVGFITTCVSVRGLIYILVAPRLYVIEQLSKLL